MKLSILTSTLVLGLAALANAAPFQNGSFEFGPNAGSYLTLATGSTAITGWMVGTGSIDYIGNYWTAQDGNRSIDLNGSRTGSISQTFDTIMGLPYMVTFWLAGNPDAGGPALKALTSSAGSATNNFSFDVTGQSRTNMGWVSEAFGFTAARDQHHANVRKHDDGPARTRAR